MFKVHLQAEILGIHFEHHGADRRVSPLCQELCADTAAHLSAYHVISFARRRDMKDPSSASKQSWHYENI
jgi:hypothetical protein